MNTRTVLILGAQGRFGGAAAQAFAAAGWRVLAQARRGDGMLQLPLTDTEGLVDVARGASAVVYAVNPLYTRWDAEMLPLARAGMAVAERLGATFMLPGNVYAYGEGMPVRLDETTPEHPSTSKGRLRQQLETELAERAQRGLTSAPRPAGPAVPRGDLSSPAKPDRLKSVIIRAGDFYGHGRGSWIDLLIAKKLAAGRLTYPGPLDVPHAWAYLPDLARAFVAVASADGLSDHERLHFAGHTLTGRQLLDAIEAAARQVGITRSIRRSRMAWWPLQIGGLVVPMLRELSRMSYLWQVPHELDGRRLAQRVGALPMTPVDVALRRTLLDLGHGAATAPAQVVA